MNFDLSKYKLKAKTAFTLAEVLITLSVIGVVASISVPSLMMDTKNNSHVAALKSIYADLSQATKLITNDNGGTMKGICDTTSSNCLLNAYLEHMNKVKSCPPSSPEGSCWHVKQEWYSYGGTPVNSSETSMGSLELANGAIAAIWHASNDCTNATEGVINPIRCGRIRVDVNGRKGPNKVGLDIYDFHILENKLVPRGTYTHNCPNGGGYYCASKVIIESAINY